MTMLQTIAHIHSDFPSKFGIPRQSGLVEGLRAFIVFEPEYRYEQALRGLEGFSHIWLLWGFSANGRDGWSPTVRPPRLGGNTRMGVFATRSPFRPNPIGLSCVKIERIEPGTPEGPIIHVLGADLMDGTPIYDIKPYLPYTDSHADAVAGFAGEAPAARLFVAIDEKWLHMLPAESHQALKEVLAQDPRPPYQRDAGRVYGMEFGPFDVKFSVSDQTLTVHEVIRLKND